MEILRGGFLLIRSMTGFGRARRVVGNYDVTVEIKSVNHRYCEMFIHLPRAFSQLEDSVRNFLKEQVIRGKTEINVNIRAVEDNSRTIGIDKVLLADYLEILSGAAKEYSLPNDVTVSTLLRLPDVVTTEKADADIKEIWQSLEPVLADALSDFVAQREKEGKFLAEDIIDKCAQIEKRVAFIRERSPKLVKEYTAKLRERISQLLGGGTPDEQRLLTEVAIMADKMAVDEEIVRLASHIQNLADIFRQGLSDGGKPAPLGKKIDFIVQEMNREINTTSSKIGDLEVTMEAIEVKNTIEKIREQIQNIE